MAQTTGRNLPPPQEPFVDGGPNDTKSTPPLYLSYSGYQYLLSVLASAASSQATASVDKGLVATGSNQATALQLNAQWNEVDTVPAGSGVLLSSFDPGQSQTVFNGGAGAPLLVYPPPGFQIDALGVNQPYSLAANSRIGFDFISDSQIRS